MRPEDHTAVAPLWGAGATLSGSSGMFLDPGLAAASGHLSPCLGVGGSLPFISLIDNQRLVNQGMIHRNGKYGIVQIDRLNRVSLGIFYRYFHLYPNPLRFGS
jgi:hypothetical protein